MPPEPAPPLEMTDRPVPPLARTDREPVLMTALGALMRSAVEPVVVESSSEPVPT